MRGLLAAGMLAVALPCAAQPRIVNGRVVEHPLAGALDRAVQTVAAGAEPAWIAWAAPVVDGRNSMCCHSGNWQHDHTTGGRCRLEPGGSTTFMNREGQGSRRLELPETFFVFVRVENRQVERVRMFSEDCELDAGTAAVTWLSAVPAAESIGYLAAVAGQPDVTDRARKGAVSALAQHRAPEAVNALVRLARRAPEAELREDALFWLSQRAGKQAADAITDAIEHDPETQVKKKAVFALSQLPADEGVPKLIAVARSHRNPAVRRQAMFWLGQSKDPRAIAFFEEVLK